MNDSHRRINPEVIDLLSKANEIKEPAFEGTVLSGRKRHYTVINENDIKKYVPPEVGVEMGEALNAALHFVEEGREREGKKPFNSYIVINTDEPYIDEIIAVMKKHDDWDK